ncbi:MAG: MmgE/PrpD family protein, partial [Chloroflexota bacterium]
TLVGSGERLPATSAALANAARIHALDFDDTHMQAVIHSSCFVVGTALSLGEALGATGRDVITAVAIGYEAATRLCLASHNEFYRRGLHTAGFFGALGAAVIAAKLLRLDSRQTSMALGIACSTGGGILQGIIDGSDVKVLHPGWAAQGGILSARLAQRGFTGPRRALEGDLGFYKALMGTGDVPLDGVLRDLGRRWETMNIAFKLYPSDHGTHHYMESALYLRKTHGIRPEEIEEVRCRVNPFRYRSNFEPPDVKYRPPTAYAARFSMPYLVAARLLRDRVGLREFSPAALCDPAVLALAQKVTREYEEAPVSLYGLGHVTIRTRDGQTYAHRIEALRGTPENPASAGDIQAKFRDNAGMALPPRRVRALIEAVEGLDKQDSVGRVVRLTVPSKRTARA